MKRFPVLGMLFLMVSIGILVVIPGSVTALTQDYFPSTQTPQKGTVSGSFPSAIQVSDNAYVTPLEGNQAPADTNLNPSTQTLTTGTNCGGTFPSALTSSDNVYLCHREADTSVTTQLDPDVETVNTGTKVSGTFPTDVTSDNGVSIVYREANVAPSSPQTLTASANGDVMSWTIGAGCVAGSEYVCEQSDDGDTSYLQSASSTNPTQFLVQLTDLPTQNGATIASIVVHIKCAKGVAQAVSVATLIKEGGTTTTGAANNCPQSPTYTDFSTTYSTNPRTGSAWAWSEANALQLGCSDIDATVRNVRCTYVYAVVTINANYELLVTYDHTAETCTDTRRLTINAWRANANMENVDVQVVDSTETTWTTRLTVTATSDGTTLTYDLTVDEWDTGTPNFRFQDTSQSGDTSQGDFNVDLAVIRCIPPANYQMEYRLDWSSQTCTGIRRLRIEAFHTDTENILVQVLTPPATWNTQITITATVDPNSYQTYDLSSTEWNSGSPAIRYLGSLESGDTTQTDVNIDDSRILCTFAADYQSQVQYDWSSVASGYDTLAFIIECKRVLNPEDLSIQVLTPPSTWNTRYTCNMDVDTTYNSYALDSSEFNGGSPSARVVDTVTGESSQSSWDLDVIDLQWNGPDVVPPGGGSGSGFSSGMMRVSCSYGFGFLSCEDTTDYKSIHNIARLEWWVDNEFRAKSDVHGHVVLAVGSHVGSPTNTVLLAVFVYFYNGGVVSHTWDMPIDNTVSYLGFAAISIAGVGFLVNRIIDRRKEPT